VSGGYPSGSNDPLIALTSEIRKLWAAIRDLSRPTGTSVASLVDQVQAALANITSTVQDAIAANSYTKTQIDSKIASPGDIAPGNVIASGNVTSSGQVQSNGAPLKSLPSHDYTVQSSYVATWTDGDGTIGTSPSSVQAKVDLTAWSSDDVAKFLDTVTPYWGRYVWDDPASPMKVFVTAEDVASAGLGTDVAPTVDRDEPMNIGTPDDPVLIDPGKPWTVNYSQLVVPLLAVAKSQEVRIAALEAQVAQLIAGGNTVDGRSRT
jgi:hypothetical protein